MSVTLGQVITLMQAMVLNNRTDVIPTAAAYQNAVMFGIQDITESYPFDELRKSGSNFTLTIGTNIYPLTDWLAVGDTNATQILVFALQYPSPASTNGYTIVTLDYKNPTELEPLTAVSGPPKFWTRFGSNIILAPNPDQAYVTYMRYQVEHPFTTAPIQSQVVMVPNSWVEIVMYAAGIRAGRILNQQNISDSCHAILFGDPEYLNSEGKRGRPGILAARVFNQERDSSNNAGMITPVLDSYTR